MDIAALNQKEDSQRNAGKLILSLYPKSSER